MREISTKPLNGKVIAAPNGYELTVGEYEDTELIGVYATEDEALRSLGRYVLAHQGESIHAHISPACPPPTEDPVNTTTTTWRPLTAPETRAWLRGANLGAVAAGAHLLAEVPGADPRTLYLRETN
jgi:hypothetical protein